MYALINNNIGTICDVIFLEQHFAEYIWLIENRNDVDIVHNDEFKNRYAIFWRMNPWLPLDYKNHYFKLLQDILENNFQTITNIVNSLYTFPINGASKIQFSFATKLLHTVNNNYPIYDSMIRDFFFLSKVNSNLDYETKRNKYTTQYNFLTREYCRILNNNLLQISIDYIRTSFHLNEIVSDIKIIDSILWSFVKYIRNGAIENGNILF